MNLLSIIPGLINLGSELIEDPDKKAEYASKALEMQIELQKAMLQTKTNPKVDAIVKLAYAGEAIVKSLFRPIGALLMFGFAAYCQLNDIQLSEAMQGILFGSPLAWGYSRHQEKKEAAKKRPQEDLWGDDDT